MGDDGDDGDDGELTVNTKTAAALPTTRHHYGGCGSGEGETGEGRSGSGCAYTGSANHTEQTIGSVTNSARIGSRRGAITASSTNGKRTQGACSRPRPAHASALTRSPGPHRPLGRRRTGLSYSRNRERRKWVHQRGIASLAPVNWR